MLSAVVRTIRTPASGSRDCQRHWTPSCVEGAEDWLRQIKDGYREGLYFTGVLAYLEGKLSAICEKKLSGKRDSGCQRCIQARDCHYNLEENGAITHSGRVASHPHLRRPRAPTKAYNETRRRRAGKAHDKGG